jgi:acetylornithine deacetylase/succinyl-diaminopimelate desuccinylase-like protein
VRSIFSRERESLFNTGARLTAATVLVVLTVLPACTPLPPEVGRRWPGSGPEYPKPDEDLRGAAAALLSAAIRFDTVNPPGNEGALSSWLASVLAREGVEARVIPPGAGLESRAALWARVKGRGQAPPIVLLSHLDVVPAEASEWAVGPFDGTVGAGYVIGRGALDAKGVTIVHLLTLALLAQEGAPVLDRDVILLATPDEEMGGSQGAALISRDRRELLGGARYLLTEGGGILPTPTGLPDVWGVSFMEKTPCWVKLTARGLAGHGSTATSNPAPGRLVRALYRASAVQNEVSVLPEVAKMFEELAPFATTDDRPHYASLRAALALHPDFRERFLADPGRAALVRNTAVLTQLQASDRTNVVPAEASGTLDVRLLPGELCTDFVEQIRTEIADPTIAIEVELSFGGVASEVDSPLMTALSEVAAASSPPGVVIPRVIAGFTDAHYFRQFGMVGYGFVPRRLRPFDTRGIHGPNERISLDNLEYGVTKMIEILQELDRVERRDPPAPGTLEAGG